MPNIPKTGNYFLDRSNDTILRIREILNDLPDFCRDFFVGIENITSPLTRLNYAYDLRIFFHFLSTETSEFYGKKNYEYEIKDLNKIEANLFERFLSYLSHYEYNGKQYNNGESGKSRKIATIRSFFAYFFKRNLISANNATKIDMPKKHEKEIVRLEPNEVANLLNESETGYHLTNHEQAFHDKTKVRDTAILTLLLGTGMRVSECVGLNIDDVDFASNGLKITRKGGNQVLLYFGEEVRNAIVNWLQVRESWHIRNSERALFVSLQKGRLTPRAIQKLVKKYSQVTTPLKRITPHKLRSTYGTALYRETQDIYIVADVLGHKDVNTTKKHYAAISEDLRKGVAGKVKLRDED